MKRFRVKNKHKVKLDVQLCLVMFLVFFLMFNYNKKISPKIVDIAFSKLEEITTLYIKKNIIPVNADLNKLINVTKNKNDEILMTDINYNYSYELMSEIVKKIQDSIFLLEQGNIKNFSNSRELKSFKNNLYLLIPLGMSSNGTLFSSLGPKIPVKVSFYEHVLGTIETTVQNYGINNAMIKVTLIIDLEQKMIVPYDIKKKNAQYKLELGSKLINGTVPSIYGGSLFQKSATIEN